MKLSVIDERDISPEIDRAICSALCCCFPADAAVFSRTRAWHGSAPSFSVVMRADKDIIAHVGVVDRVIEAGAGTVRVAGLQNVMVIPEYRGLGLAAEIVRVAMKEAAKLSFECGLLFCIPVLEKVYAAAGWMSLGMRDVIRLENGTPMPIPDKNIAMYYPIRLHVFPAGRINLLGNDW